MIAPYVIGYLCVGYVVMCLTERGVKEAAETDQFWVYVILWVVLVPWTWMMYIKANYLPEDKLRKWIRGF